MHTKATPLTLIDPLCDEEISTVNKQSNNQMLGIILLTNADKMRCGRLLVNLHNDFIIGNNNYPNAFTKAFSLLSNQRREHRKKQFSKEKESGVGGANKDESGASFVQRRETAVLGTNSVLHASVLCCNCRLLGYYAGHCPNSPRNTGF